MTSIANSTRAYEAWLGRLLGGAIVKSDLSAKHAKMRESPFAFLRATYWRWAETAFEVCPEAADAPAVLCVGDIHLENFGTWRDTDGRLIWGVNDFDEAAVMPYVMDLVRLSTSARIASRPASTDDICASILKGYRSGLSSPRAIVLDRDNGWLRAQVEVSEKRRAKFWKKITTLKQERAPVNYRTALSRAMPDGKLVMRTARRSAGAGSLGRPRWIGVADWHGAPVVREAKAILPSAWTRARGKARGKITCAEIANGRYRAVDPWLHFTSTIVVRRTSPNNRKIEAGENPEILLSSQMLELMGFDLASVHKGVAGRSSAIARDLARRKPGWLTDMAAKMAAAVEADHSEWKRTAAR